MKKGSQEASSVKMPAPESWLKTASREPQAARLSHGLFRNAPKDHPESSSPATKASHHRGHRSQRFVEILLFHRQPGTPLFSGAAPPRGRLFLSPMRGMPSRGGSQKFTPSGRPLLPSRSPCQEIKVIPPKTSRSSPSLSGKNSGRPPLGSKTYHPFRGNFLQKFPEPLRVVNG